MRSKRYKRNGTNSSPLPAFVEPGSPPPWIGHLARPMSVRLTPATGDVQLISASAVSTSRSVVTSCTELRDFIQRPRSALKGRRPPMRSLWQRLQRFPGMLSALIALFHRTEVLACSHARCPAPANSRPGSRRKASTPSRSADTWRERAIRAPRRTPALGVGELVTCMADGLEYPSTHRVH